jgi:hypothetical protein
VTHRPAVGDFYSTTPDATELVLEVLRRGRMFKEVVMRFGLVYAGVSLRLSLYTGVSLRLLLYTGVSLRHSLYTGVSRRLCSVAESRT